MAQDHNGITSFGNLHATSMNSARGGQDDSTPQIRAVHQTTSQRKSAAGQHLVGKIVFYKDSDILSHQMEKLLGRWAALFHGKLGQYCAAAPRFTELRPLDFMPE